MEGYGGGGEMGGEKRAGRVVKDSSQRRYSVGDFVHLLGYGTVWISGISARFKMRTSTGLICQVVLALEIPQ